MTNNNISFVTTRESIMANNIPDVISKGTMVNKHIIDITSRGHYGQQYCRCYRNYPPFQVLIKPHDIIHCHSTPQTHPMFTCCKAAWHHALHLSHQHAPQPHDTIHSRSIPPISPMFILYMAPWHHTLHIYPTNPPHVYILYDPMTSCTAHLSHQ